jgi:NAD(P)-dependent dehydrogenase (short-subunit alcohol dehydrogenase family)
MLDGKTALVTGSSQGIGLAIGRAFAQHGARVVLTSERAFEQCADLVSVFDAARMSYVAANLVDEQAPARLVEAANAHLGGIDIVVNNVGT